MSLNPPHLPKIMTLDGIINLSPHLHLRLHYIHMKQISGALPTEI